MEDNINKLTRQVIAYESQTLDRLCLFLPNEQHELAKNLSLRESREAPPGPGQAPVQLCCLAPRWDITQAPIAGLPNYLREAVYKELLNEPNANLSNWQSRLSPSLRSLVENKLLRENSPSFEQGFHYIFKANKLWQTVNCSEQNNIIVLEKIKQQPILLNIIYSPVKLSQERIEYIEKSLIKLNLQKIKYNYPELLIQNIYGLVKNIQADLAKVWGKFIDLLNKIYDHPYSDSAILAYHIFYGNHKLHQDYKKYLDKNLIENILEIKNRKILKNKIRILQAVLIELIDTDDFNFMLENWLSADFKYYPYGFSIMDSLLALTHTDPSLLEGQLEFSKEQNKTPPGINYLIKLISQDHPLNNKIFPTESDIDIYQAQNKQTISCQPSILKKENDGSGRFRKKTFACISMQSLDKKNNINYEYLEDEDGYDEYRDVWEGVPGILDTAVRGLMLALKRVMKHMGNRLHDTYATAMRLAKATNLVPELYIQEGIYKTNFIPGLEFLFEKNTAKLSPVPIKGIPVYFSGADHPSAFATVTENYGINNIPMTGQAKYWLENKLKYTKLARLARLSKTATTQLKKSEEVIALLLASVALLNLEQTTIKIINTHGTERVRASVEELGVIASLLDSVKSTSEVLLGPISVDKFLDNHELLKFISKDEISWGKMLATPLDHSIYILSSLGIMFSCYDFMMDIWHDNIGEADGESVSLLGAAVLLMSQRGRSVRRKLGHNLAKRLLKKDITKLFISEYGLTDTIAMFITPFGWVGSVVIFIGAVISAFLDDDDLTAWCKHGPFGIKPRARFSGNYKSWKIPGKEYFACESLMSIFLSPRITRISSLNNSLVIEVNLNQFIPGEDKLDLRAWRESNSDISFTRTNTPTWFLIKEAFPYKVIQIMSEEAIPRVIRMQYYFKKIKIPEGEQIRINTKVRLITGEKSFILPCPEFPTEKDNQLETSSWAYTDRPYVI